MKGLRNKESHYVMKLLKRGDLRGSKNGAGNGIGFYSTEARPEGASLQFILRRGTRDPRLGNPKIVFFTTA